MNTIISRNNCARCQKKTKLSQLRFCDRVELSGNRYLVEEGGGGEGKFGENKN